MIQRKEYLEQLINWRERDIIKVVTGVRRSGKSTLLALYVEYLKGTGVSEEQIVSVNLEDMDFEHLLDYKALHEYIKDRLCKDKTTYIFIDEVQRCSQFEKAIDSLYIKKNVDIYITGSNAYMLSSELVTLLSGRYIEIKMLPFSFKEYLQTGGEDNKSKAEHFSDYLRFGSFPYVSTLPKKEADVNPYIEGVYNTIILKDVAQREGITDISILESIAKFLCSNVGSPVSAKKISDTINSSGRKISVNTVGKYLKAFTDSFIFYRADRYDVKGRQFLKTLGKYYIVDTGIRTLLTAGSAAETGHLLENIVYLELLRRGYKVSIGKWGEKEIDFVASNSDGIVYYQVAASVLDASTLKRELTPLKGISDNHPKILLTLDEVGSGANHDGIRQQNVLSWLTE